MLQGICTSINRQGGLEHGIIKKIMIFPIMLLLGIVKVLLDLIIKAETWVAGVGFLLLAIFTILAAINGQWIQLGVFGGLMVIGIIILLFSAYILVIIDILIGELKG